MEDPTFAYPGPKELIGNLPVAAYLCTITGEVVAFNSAALELWGRAPGNEENCWSGAWKILKRDGREVTAGESPAAKAVKTGIAESEDLFIVRPDGSRIAIRAYPSLLFDEQGRPTGVMETMIDMTTQLSSDEKQARLAAIVETSDDTVVSKTLDGIITSWNRAAERMFGHTEEEAVGKHISILIPPERLHEEEHIISQVAGGNKVDHFETIRITKSGERIPISLTVSPIKDASGKIIGASKIARDIRDQKAAAEAAERYTKNLEIINSMGNTISGELDLDTLLQKVTDLTTELTGAKFGAFFYNNVNEQGESYLLFTLSGAAREAFEKFGMPRNTAVFDATFSGAGVVRVDDITKDPRYGHNHPHKGMPKGHLPVVSYLAVPVSSKSGEVLGGLFFGHPEPGMFSKEHETVVQAIAMQASIGINNARLYNEIKSLNEKKDEFIGMASHELKTPLTSISAYLQILDRFDLDEKAKGFLGKAVRMVSKLSVLVNDLLDVSKIEAGKLSLVKQAFDINRVISDAIELMRHNQSTHVISFYRKSNSCMVNGDRERIEQVMINLLTNAIKYSPDASHVGVEIICEQELVTVSVTDEGIGIPKDKIEHIFDRFYRVEGLRPDMSGLGIGLFISHEIIRRHNGTLKAESEEGKGSVFSFTLPSNAVMI